MNTYTVCAVTFIVMVLLCSEFEHRLHKGAMHKPLWIFGKKVDAFFIAHALVHHQIFKADHTYHLQNDDDKPTITMGWWHGFALALGCSILGLIAGFLLGWTFTVWLTSFLTVYAYYGVYERIHWCMHLPKKRIRFLERWFVPFKWLNGHHILHHRYMGKNFNVVFPFADLLHGTLMLRSPIRFGQPLGPMVPDVQPLEKSAPKEEELAEV